MMHATELTQFFATARSEFDVIVAASNAALIEIIGINPVIRLLLSAHIELFFHSFAYTGGSTLCVFDSVLPSWLELG